MRTAVYVDGFNLFHRLLEGRPDVKWLDLFALATSALRDENDVVLVRYFTARVADTIADPGKSTRQDIYLRALDASGVVIHYGTFRQRQKRARLVEPAPHGMAEFVRVWSREEKGSDVNLAVHMMNDAWRDAYDCAVVLSNDSDLAEALRLVRDMGKVVGILCPAASPVIGLRQHADFSRCIAHRQLLNAQFPEHVHDAAGRTVSRPSSWTVGHSATRTIG